MKVAERLVRLKHSPVLRNVMRMATSPLRAPFVASENLLYGAYQMLRRLPSPRLHDHPVPAEHTERVCDIVATLHRDGVARWPGLFADDEFLARARQAVEHVHERMKEAHVLETHGEVFDLERGWKYFGDAGRCRIEVRDWSREVPEPLREVIDHPLLTAIAARYYRSEVYCNGVLTERIDTDSQDNKWHFDRMLAQCKAMILLSDVDAKGAPLRYKTGSHKWQHKLKPVYHQIFLHGIDQAVASTELVFSEPGEMFIGTGKAGDCIFFDTLGIHSGAACQLGERINLVANYTVHNVLNVFFKGITLGRAFHI